MSLLETVTDQLNLRWAWEKVRRASTPGDVWINEIELAGFEVELEANLHSIAAEIRKGRYGMGPLRPMAFPKNPTKDGKQQVRQYFNVSVRDQVAWTAVVNVIGPHLDQLMPAWSYGNRLFRSIWVDTDEAGIRRRKIGSYRHTSGRIYLSFGQSWPVFRRHVYLATSAMTTTGTNHSSKELSEEDEDELSLQDRLTAEHRCPFVRREYWDERQPEAGKENLFWCSIDLEKFYPSLKLDEIHRNICEFLPIDMKSEAELLVGSMLRFSLDTTGWSREDLSTIGIKPHQKSFNHIPTGLFVAGFLANVGLLKIDLEVARRLEKANVAHFRFVDDHVILTYSFQELVRWVDEYRRLLSESETGSRVNPEKIEPEELAKYLSFRSKVSRRTKTVRDSAMKACRLNPQFPTPLMTKTLALVSAIARTDFNLLEESELISLTDQLEHMLLVELPEAEIPEKTRLSFAATRLMRLAECRLANDSHLAELACRNQELAAELSNKAISPERHELLEKEIKANSEDLKNYNDYLDRAISKVFGLLRKVLQERPDRVRLWTRAIQMCRQTGVRGVAAVLADVDRVKREHNILAAEYLMANMLSLLGSEVTTAARLICDPEVSEWRKKAAHSFLTDICSTVLPKPEAATQRWFLQISWNQYCFGLFCADLIIKSSPTPDVVLEGLLPTELVSHGELILAGKVLSEHPLSWAWWAVRPSLRDLSARADRWVMEIGQRLPPTRQSYAFWRFFPFDVPPNAIRDMIDEMSHARGIAVREGWWHDALGARKDVAEQLLSSTSNPTIARVLRNITLARRGDSDWVSLHEWCQVIRDYMEPTDPRACEWTALQIVRQIASIIATTSQEFGLDYVHKSQRTNSRPLCIHPANFRLPRIWLEKWRTGKAPTWGEWVLMICPSVSSTQIRVVPEDHQIGDSRYTPVSGSESPLFTSINPIRGLGLLLYGLLRHSFLLPSLWNGPGHADFLALLPRLLLKDMTCSSWTLGVLQGCLQPRAMENLFLKLHQHLAFHLDDDTVHDPIRLLTPRQVSDVIDVCLSVLERNQLSTLNHRARQLTPICIRQLTQPDWVKVFQHQPEGGITDVE